MGWMNRFKSMMGFTQIHEAVGWNQRARQWHPGNPGPVSTGLAMGDALRTKARDLVRRDCWANAAVDAFVSNAISTGIKPQSMCHDESYRTTVQKLWQNWVEEADVSGQTDFYGLQALATRSMVEAGECFIRILPRPAESGLAVPLQIQVLESEHVPLNLNTILPNGNLIRSGVEFSPDGERVAYHVYTSHPGDGSAGVTLMTDIVPVRIAATEIVHLFRPLRPGQIRGESWLSRALVRLFDLDQYQDAELVRKKTAAMFAGFITRQNPEENLMGEAAANDQGISQAGLEPGTMQVLEPGEDIKFSGPADVGASYSEFMKSQFRAIAAAVGITYEQLTGDLSSVNYSSIRAGSLEFRRKCEAVQHSVIVHQMCRPIWAAFVKQAVLSGALTAGDFNTNSRDYLSCKWVPAGWAWVDPLKDVKANIMAIRAGLTSRSEAISADGYDAQDIDLEIAADNARADRLGLKLDSDPRWEAAAQATDQAQAASESQNTPDAS